MHMKYMYLVLYLVLIFLGVEMGLRLLGYQPYVKQYHQKDQIFHKIDDQLGWKLIAGQYKIPINTFADSMRLTVKVDTGRATRVENSGLKLDKVVFLGGSFTMGRGVDDDETFVWKTQEKFPGLDFRNLGVGAYGTYQSLMVLENEIKKRETPKVVIYGLIDNHMHRNVAQAKWMEVLYYNRYDTVPEIPFITMNDNGTLIRNKPTSHTKLPLSMYFITMLQLERSINMILSYKREQNAKEVLKILILEMKELCERQNIQFYVNVLHWNTDGFSDLIKFFQSNKIQHINCNVPLSEDNTIKDDGHPDESVHKIWADSVLNRLTKDGFLN